MTSQLRSSQTISQTVPERQITLHLRKKPKVQWQEDVVDNEFMNKKKSKKCCIYHKKRAFDESDSESDSEGGSEGEDHKDCDHDHDPNDKAHHNHDHEHP